MRRALALFLLTIALVPAGCGGDDIGGGGGTNTTPTQTDDSGYDY